MLPHHGKKPKESSLENGAQLEENKTRGISYCLAESTLFYRKALKTARSDYFSSLLEENKHSPRYLFNTVAKFTKNKASTGVEISQQHSSIDFMNYFTSKIDTIKRCKSRAAKIIKDSNHPGNHFFTSLPSGKRFRSMTAKTERLRRSFFPQAIRLLNSVS